MSQVILRFDDKSNFVETLVDNENGYLSKTIALSDAFDFIREIVPNNSVSFSGYTNNLIYMIIKKKVKYLFYHFKTRKVISTYNEKAYSYFHPETLFVLCEKDSVIEKIEAYFIKDFNGLDTELYKYLFPNLLGGSSLCIGTVSTLLKDGNNYEDILLNCLEANYTHSQTYFKNESLKTTEKMFAYFKDRDKLPEDEFVEFNYNIKELIKKKEDDTYDNSD